MQLSAAPVSGEGASIDDEHSSLSTTYSSDKIERLLQNILPVADDETLGGVKIDGDSITIDEYGYIHSEGGSGDPSLPTEIINPQDGQALVYNGLTHKWVNGVGGGGAGDPITEEQILALFSSDGEYVLDGDNYSV